MPRCCSNIFLNQFTQQPPDVIVDPPGASLCYHYEDVELPGINFDYQYLSMDYVTINGVQTPIGKTAFDFFVPPGDWSYDFLSFNYSQVVTDMTVVAAAAGVIGMGFFIASNGDTGVLGFRFSITGENINSASITYTYDTGVGPVQVTTPITQSNCEVEYLCFGAEYTPEDPFLIEFGAIHAITNTGLTIFETQYFGPFCTEMGDMPAFIDAIIPYIQTLHGTQATATLDVVGNTATFRILNTLLVPLHMDNQADSGCTPPNSLEQVNNFTEISCP